MPDEDYYTTNTKSVASEIDISDLDAGGEAADGEWRFEWKRPLGYLLLALFVVFAYVLTDLWLGVELPLVP